VKQGGMPLPVSLSEEHDTRSNEINRTGTGPVTSDTRAKVSMKTWNRVHVFYLSGPTPMLHRVPRGSLGSPHPSSGYFRPESPVLLSEVQSGVQHLLGLLGGTGDPHFVVEMHRLPPRRLNY
jgi:hypothetical protein